ncbi:hypothetical protein PBN151_5977 [Paenibacillus sp. NAIST15-1]|nr:hypothetical protein PBN151_5977 [Paenibacillus sp. NAIST15-1]
MSAIYAIMDGIKAAEPIPPINRDANNKVRSLANAASRLESANKTKPIIIIGLRPYRSDKLPAMGENINWVRPKQETKYPAACPLAENSSRSSGTIGMTRPILRLARNMFNSSNGNADLDNINDHLYRIDKKLRVGN